MGKPAAMTAPAGVMCSEANMRLVSARDSLGSLWQYLNEIDAIAKCIPLAVAHGGEFTRDGLICDLSKAIGSMIGNALVMHDDIAESLSED
jgi:hypothetical protein